MCGVSEPWMPDLLARLLPAKSGAFLDVGVNLGQTLLAVKACEPGRQYVGVEPNAHCVAYVERFIEMNGFTDCLIVPVGLGKETGLRRLQLYHGTTTDSSASIVEDFRPDRSVSCVKIVPVFPFQAIEHAVGISALGIIKIDVEGAEAEILSSMREILLRDNPWLIVEILPCYGEDNLERIERQNSIETLMAVSNYVKFRILRAPNGHLQCLSSVVRIGIHGDLEWCDYLFCPRGDIAAIAKLVAIEGEQ
jgi:FkbM family methyltransferase